MAYKKLILILFFFANVGFALEEGQPEEFVEVESPLFGTCQILTKKPEFVMIHDAKSNTSRPKFAFLINRAGETSYLAVEPVAQGKYEYAFFVDRSSISHEKTYSTQDFELLFYDDGTYRIRSTHGEESFLALRPLSKDSYQYAIFATKEYIEKYHCISHFDMQSQDGVTEFVIQSATKEQPGFLAIEQVASGGQQYAFFGTKTYLKTRTPESYSVVFDINTSR